MTRITIDFTNEPRCEKCNTVGKMISRHHMGYDSLVALYNKKIRDTYHLFEKCCRLCDECHMEIHWLYLPIVRRHKNWSPSGVLNLRARLIQVCKKWLKGEYQLLTPVSSEFRQKWTTDNLGPIQKPAS